MVRKSSSVISSLDCPIINFRLIHDYFLVFPLVVEKLRAVFVLELNKQRIKDDIMPKFSTASQNKLFTCHPELQLLFREVIKYFDCTVIEGFRNEADQNKAFAEGKSKLKWPNGNHNKNPSMAVDVAPYPIEWNNTKRMYWFGGFVLGVAQMLKNEGKMTYTVRYGGDWNGNKDIDDQTFNDTVHFELVP